MPFAPDRSAGLAGGQVSVRRPWTLHRTFDSLLSLEGGSQVFDSRFHVTNSLKLLSSLLMRHFAFPHPASVPQWFRHKLHISVATHPTDIRSFSSFRKASALLLAICPLERAQAVRTGCTSHGSAITTVRSSFSHTIAAFAVVSLPVRAGSPAAWRATRSRSDTKFRVQAGLCSDINAVADAASISVRSRFSQG